MIDKKELKYIGYSVGFALFWFLVVIPLLIKDGIQDKSPYFQFLLFTLGLFFFLQIFLKSIALDTRAGFLKSIGIICLFLALDTLMPAYSIGVNGSLLEGNIVLYKSSTDYVWGYFASSSGLDWSIKLPDFFMSIINSILHLFNSSVTLTTTLISFVFIFTYIVMPFILLIISAGLIPNFVRHL